MYCGRLLISTIVSPRSDVTYDCQDIEIQVISDSQPFQLDDDVWLLHTPVRDEVCCLSYFQYVF